jgi:hypothetical protein
LLLSLAVGTLFLSLGQTLRSDARSEDRAPALAALGAMIAAAVHETFDFGLTLPANLLALALVCGAAAGWRAAAKTAAPEAILSSPPEREKE